MNPIKIGLVFLALGIAIAYVYFGILVGGVMDDTAQDVFNDVGLNGTTWDSLRSTATTNVSNAMKISLISIVLLGISVLLAVIFGFAQGVPKSV